VTTLRPEPAPDGDEPSPPALVAPSKRGKDRDRKTKREPGVDEYKENPY
jgi:hypothetical protein